MPIPAPASCPITRPRSNRQLKAGKTILVPAHGNSLRSLVMVIEGLTPEQILKRELATGEPVIYQINADGSLDARIAL